MFVCKNHRKSAKIKIVSLIICTVMISVGFLSCGTKYKSAITLKHDNKEYIMTVNMYNYFLSEYKTRFLAQYGYEQDAPDVWSEPFTDPTYPNAATLGDVISMQISDSLKGITASEAAFDYYKLSLTKEELNDIDVFIKNIVNSDKYGKSTKILNDTLGKYSLNMDMYKKVCILVKKHALLYEYLVNENTGINKPTEEEAFALYLQDTMDYVRIKHVLISTMSEEVDEEGNPIPYTDETKLAEIKTKADDIYNQATSGVDFESLLSESEDPGTASNPDGYIFTYGSGMVSEFETAAFEMKVDEIRTVQSEFGYHIMKKYSIEELYEQYKSSYVNEMKTMKFNELLEPFIEKIIVEESEIKNFNFATIPVLFDDTELFPLQSQ